MSDVGYEGQFRVIKIDGGSLLDLQKVAGPAPADGKHWVMVDLYTGQLKWYRGSRRKSYGYSRRRRY